MKTIQEMIEVMQAHANGDSIECKNNSCVIYTKISNPAWSWNDTDYRVMSLATVEGKPVHKGDILYRKDDTNKVPLLVVGSCDQEDTALGKLIQVKNKGVLWANLLTWDKSVMVTLVTMVDIEQGDTLVVVHGSTAYSNAIVDGLKHIPSMDRMVEAAV